MPEGIFTLIFQTQILSDFGLGLIKILKYGVNQLILFGFYWINYLAVITE
jgi:hypothetical protein